MRKYNHLNGFWLFIPIILIALCFSGISLAATYRLVPTTEPVSIPFLKNAASPSLGYFIYDEGTDSFHTYGSAYNFRLKSEALSISLPSDAAELQFLGANPNVHLVGRNLAVAKANVFIGNDPTQWRHQAPMYTEVVYQALYPGIDLVCTLENGQLKSEFQIHPGADPGDIRLRATGAVLLSLEQDLLALELASGDLLHEHVYRGYQDIGAQRHEVPVAFRLLDENTYTFAVQGSYSPDYPLTIDPVFIYSTYIGGSGNDQGFAIAADKTGAIYISGITASLDLPLTDPEQYAEGVDVFLAKVYPDGQLAYVSIFGGFSGERGNAVAVDGAGNAYVAGETFSPDFPILNAWQPFFAGYEDAFVLKVDGSGDLIYSTFLGGSHADEINDIVVDAIGNVYVGGEVYSDDFPLINPWSTTTYGIEDEDAFISIFNAHGQLVYSTYVSASERDQVFRIAVDHEGYVYGTGMTSSPDFPLVNPLQPSYGGDWKDCIVFKLDPWTNTMVYSTFLGGMGRDECRGIAVDEEGAAYVTGFTMSPNFPVVNAVQDQLRGESDVFVAKLSPTGDTLLFSTFLGGSAQDKAWGLGLDGGNNIYITGHTYSSDFPLRDALQPHFGGYRDAFVSAFTSEGALLYSSYLGGSEADRGWRLAVDDNWIVHVTGSTKSHDFPLRSPAQSHRAGQIDTFVASFGLVPTPTPTPTPTPYASAQIGAEGGALWLSYPDHLTLLQVPAGAVNAPTTFELAYDGRPNMQGPLQGLNHFFALSIQHPQRVTSPLQLYLAYAQTGGVIADTLDLYRLDGSTWVTHSITVTEQTAGHTVAWITQPGIYGVLGETNRVYLPLLIRR